MSKTHRPTIGWIVAGSLLFGFLLAVLLVALPFAGAEENIISGVVLLAFAVGWALLALLSRLTDQPQRWPIVTAGVMATCGIAMVAWPDAIVHDGVGWVWPPVLLTLVAWMGVRSRRELRSPTRYWLLYPLFAALALAAVGGLYEMARETSDRSALPMPGKLVDVGGHRLHLHCIGSGSPTVVLLPGAGGFSSSWGWIAPAIARDARVCVYDLAGRGWSESATRPQDGVALATDLHNLLANANETGPYVLAGHSFGGLYVLNFAARYPEQVAGVVLLDSTHPDMFTRLPAYPMIWEAFRRASAVFPSLARLGIGRVVYRSDFDKLPLQSRREEVAFWSTARMARSQHAEWTEAPIVMRQAHSLTTLSPRPLIVVTAALEAQDGWVPLQRELAALSVNSQQRVVPDATHMSLVDDERDACNSTDAIRAVIQAVRGGTPLSLLAAR
jgi:pimeloyl-ACP methyl ester carboxylesterase